MDIAILYRKSCCFLCSSIGFHLLPGKGIASPGAILPVWIAVALKDVAALLARDSVIGFLIKRGIVLFPPGHAAAIRAVTLDLLVRGLDQRLPTVTAQAFMISDGGRRQWITAKVNL